MQSIDPLAETTRRQSHWENHTSAGHVDCGGGDSGGSFLFFIYLFIYLFFFFQKCLVNIRREVAMAARAHYAENKTELKQYGRPGVDLLKHAGK